MNDAPIPLTIAIADAPHVAALKAGHVAIAGAQPHFLRIAPQIAAFRRMVRKHEFDITEMAITTYMAAKAYGKKFTAVPVFIVRAFHHGAILVNKNAGVKSPKDLAGKYTVTTGVWARSILQEEHGVDLSKVTWVLSGDEHVAEYVPPKNVVPIEAGKKMEDMLVSGELVAAIGVDVKHPDVVPLIPNAAEAGYAAYQRNGHYPINHLVVIKDELIEKHPGLARDIYEAFKASRDLYVEKLKAGQIETLDAADKVHQKVIAMGGYPLPYGVEANRKTIETLIGHALTQGIITQRVKVEDLFAKETWG